MKEYAKKESDQWIPWEISYSLKEITRSDRTSHTNGVLGIVLPDIGSSYEYYLKEKAYPLCDCTTLSTVRLFGILRDNMFNTKKPDYVDCSNHPTNTVYKGSPSYIPSIKWCDFLESKEQSLQVAENLRDHIDDYDIRKVVQDA